MNNISKFENYINSFQASVPPPPSPSPSPSPFRKRQKTSLKESSLCPSEFSNILKSNFSVCGVSANCCFRIFLFCLVVRTFLHNFSSELPEKIWAYLVFCSLQFWDYKETLRAPKSRAWNRLNLKSISGKAMQNHWNTLSEQFRRYYRWLTGS